MFSFMKNIFFLLDGSVVFITQYLLFIAYILLFCGTYEKTLTIQGWKIGPAWRTVHTCKKKNSKNSFYGLNYIVYYVIHGTLH